MSAVKGVLTHQIPLFVLHEGQFAQHNVQTRIKDIVVYNLKRIDLITEKGDHVFVSSEDLKWPRGKNEEEMEPYLKSLRWVVTQALRSDTYFVTTDVRGDGGGGGVSTGKPGTKPLSGDILKIYKDLIIPSFRYRKVDLDLALCWVMLKICQNKSKVGTIYRTADEVEVPYSYDWIEKLLKAGASPDAKGTDGVPVLAAVCQVQTLATLDAAERLIAHGADVTFLFENRSLLSHFASNPKLCGLIIQAAKSKGIDLEERDRKMEEESWKAKASTVDNKGETALDKAFRANLTQDAQKLLSSGADVNKGYPLHACLHWAAISKLNSDLEILELLLERKPDLNRKDDKGVSPLELASARVILFDRLVKAGAVLTDPTIAKAVFLAAIKYGTERAIHPYLNGSISAAQGLHHALSCNVVFFRSTVAAGISVDYIDAEHPETCLQMFCRITKTWDQKEVAALNMLIELKADQTKIQGPIFQALLPHVKLLFPELLNADPYLAGQRKAFVSAVIAGIDFQMLDKLKSEGKIAELEKVVSEKIQKHEVLTSMFLNYTTPLPNAAISRALYPILVQNLLTSSQNRLDQAALDTAIDTGIANWQSEQQAIASQKQNEEYSRQKAEEAQKAQEQQRADLEARVRQGQQEQERLQKELEQTRLAAAAAYSAAQKAKEDYKRSLVPGAYWG